MTFLRLSVSTAALSPLRTPKVKPQVSSSDTRQRSSDVYRVKRRFEAYLISDTFVVRGKKHYQSFPYNDWP